jgi:cytochrome b
LGLIVFRVIWGFIGGEHARFRAFVRGPGAMAAHVRDLGSPAPKR